jgi:hypothetical protein
MRVYEKRVVFFVLLLTFCIVGPNFTWRARVGWIESALPNTVEYKEAFSTNGKANIDYSKNSSLLIVQYTDGNTYSALLNLTQPINRAYAEKWGYDYELFTGLLIQAEIPPSSNGHVTRKAPPSRATYNKVMILDKVLNDFQYQTYDKLLIMDSDALMYDFSRDIAALLPKDRMMLAHKVKRNESNSSWNINIGVTMWNLRHIASKPVCRAWKKACIQRITKHPTLRDSDQTPLQAIMKDIPDEDRQKMILAIPDELGYGTGRFIRHFIRPNAANWTDYVDTMPLRIAKIQRTITEICNHTYSKSDHPDICNEYIDYSMQEPTQV